MSGSGDVSNVFHAAMMRRVFRAVTEITVPVFSVRSMQ